MAVANYGRSVSTFIAPSGGVAPHLPDIWASAGNLISRAVPERQEAPHPHMLLPFASNTVLVP